MKLFPSLLFCALLTCVAFSTPAHSDDTTPLADQITALQTQMMAQPGAKARVFYVTSDQRDAVLKRALKFGKADFAAMRAASALYRQIAADYYEQGLRAPGAEAEVTANLYDSLAVLYHPENLQVQAELVAAADAMLLKTKSEYAGAAPNFATAAEWKEDGNQQSQKGRLWLALQRYQKALEVNPKFADAQNNIGSIYQQLNDLPRANDAFRAAIALDPQHRVAHFNLANSYHKLGFDKEALSSANNALLFAASLEVESAVLNLSAQIRLALNDHVGAIKDWRMQIINDPKTPQVGRVWSNIGMVALSDADVKTAQDAFKNSVDAAPLSDMFQTLYAMSLNAFEMQILADIRGVKLVNLPMDKQHELGKLASQQLQNVQPILGAYRIDPALLDYWNETIPDSALSKPENAPLLRRCQSVLDSLTPRREN